MSSEIPSRIGVATARRMRSSALLNFAAAPSKVWPYKSAVRWAVPVASSRSFCRPRSASPPCWASARIAGRASASSARMTDLPLSARWLSWSKTSARSVDSMPAARRADANLLDGSSSALKTLRNAVPARSPRKPALASPPRIAVVSSTDRPSCRANGAT